jgi:hypothetical protein
MWKVWTCFKKGSILSITMLGALFFILITQTMVICFYTSLPLNRKLQLYFYRQSMNYAANFFSCASVLHRFYSLIPAMTQLCCIKNVGFYKIFTFFITGFLFLFWGASLYLVMAQESPTTLSLSFGVFYWAISFMIELMTGTILLYLVLKSKRPTMKHLSTSAYFLANYKSILALLLCYISVLLAGSVMSSFDVNLGMFSFSFVRLLGAIFEGWYHICQVWFLILIRDTSQSMDNSSKISHLTQGKNVK